jgi:hypothetical protein
MLVDYLRRIQKNRPRGDANTGSRHLCFNAGALLGEQRVIRAAFFPSISQLESLIRQRHFDAGVGKMCGELFHGVVFAVD